ncbi:MAG: hypothetical protein DRR16_32075 [Candidatus Parabeggiatoa sp. nov. 3]|nr:MAG: hypothetical protein DRR00_32835 [Gammaproteobacteria bacterium]RKZ53074.1 MAG: hypothetical protein DRQ99_32005 [Gammaproteobacteria bacterium]RKZ74533.1 MAG: hypothetical protein DRR16_32075 [Gammaproteobacteria bacterium]
MTKTSLLAIFAAFSLALSGALVSADEGQQELEPQAEQQELQVQGEESSEEIKSEGEQEEAQNETQSEGNGS